MIEGYEASSVGLHDNNTELWKHVTQHGKSNWYAIFFCFRLRVMVVQF